MDKKRISLLLFHCLSILIVICLSICVVLITKRLGNIQEWNEYATSREGKKARFMTYQTSCLNFKGLRNEVDWIEGVNLWFEWRDDCDFKSRCWRMGSNW